MSVDLFVRTDGRPMVFLMNYVIEREDVGRAVEERGGVLVEDISPSICDNVIRLLARTEMAISRNYDMFYYHYIMDCIEADTLLPQLYRYRVCTSVPSPYGMYDPLDILLGNIGWSEVPINGEVVSDTDNEVEMDEDTARAEAEYKAFKCEQIPFTDCERREILNGVIARHSYAMVSEDLLWKILQEKKLCRGRRTWQSMKEQFEKVIVPDISNYGLNRNKLSYSSQL